MSQTRKEIILRKRKITPKSKRKYVNENIVITKDSKPIDTVGLISKNQTIYINTREYSKVFINFKKTIFWICKGWTPNLESFEYIEPIFYSGFYNTKKTKKTKKLINNLIHYLSLKKNTR